LNEKLRGASSSKLLPSDGRDSFSENVRISDSSGHQLDLGDALGQDQRGLHRLGEPAVEPVAEHQTVDDDVDVVVLVAGEFERAVAGDVGELVHHAVDRTRAKPCLARVGEQLLVGALAAPHHRREHLEAGAVGQGQHLVDDLLGRLADERLARLGVVRDADAGVEQPEVVVDLGDGADRGARVADADFWSIEMAGDRPSMISTSGLSIWPRNWRA
jgi:hypothetical protein